MGIFNLTALSGQEPAAQEEPQKVVAETTDTPITVGVDKTDKSDEQLITLDGPLSRIYTKALNLAYARENMTMLSPDAMTLSASEQEEITESTYVYCVDTSMMDAAQLVASTEHFRKATESGKYKNCVLALESDGTVNSRMQLFAEMGQSLGAKVCYTRNSAIDSLMASRLGG